MVVWGSCANERKQGGIEVLRNQIIPKNDKSHGLISVETAMFLLLLFLFSATSPLDLSVTYTYKPKKMSTRTS